MIVYQTIAIEPRRKAIYDLRACLKIPGHRDDGSPIAVPQGAIGAKSGSVASYMTRFLTLSQRRCAMLFDIPCGLRFFARRGQTEYTWIY
ncbi:MAG: hypothetical protein HKP13_01135 [Gammaproteobacteria bacterium]|nr:hypothetical protein [Gammaproteobacteria bacterium]